MQSTCPFLIMRIVSIPTIKTVYGITVRKP